MLTKDFYEECHKVVRAGIRKGWIVCPPLEKPAKQEAPAFRVDRPCRVCGIVVSMHSYWQKMCYPCSIETGRRRSKERHRKLKLEKQNRISKSKIENEKAKGKIKTS